MKPASARDAEALIERDRCIAPIGDDGQLCGAPATEERTVEGLVCRLCVDHAAELDAENSN